jgi:hypothetical protein
MTPPKKEGNKKEKKRVRAKTKVASAPAPASIPFQSVTVLEPAGVGQPRVEKDEEVLTRLIA